MAVNKIQINGKVELDLTADTVTADKLLSGITAHDKGGNAITGSVVVHTARIGEAGEPPDDSVGVDGDIYFVPKG